MECKEPPATPSAATKQLHNLMEQQMASMMEEMERSLAEAKRKRMEEFERETQELEAKRHATQQAWEMRCLHEDEQRRKMQEAEMDQHRARLEKETEAQRKRLQRERDTHEEKLALLLEQISAASSQLEASQQVSRQPPAATKEDLKAKLKEKTDLARQSMHVPKQAPRPTGSPPSAASLSTTGPAPSEAPSQPQLLTPTSLAPNTPQSDIEVAPGTMVRVAQTKYNSSTHPKAWGILNRMAKSADCDKHIVDAWNAGPVS